ncbi:MAG TPA: two-component regulator propeller domain-containing protein, partial [Candidatus Synoicihabitans sp.]|nr:two-component regulator propeller domain-containing protein [Candidatus Synoicihabitans sp.]
MSLFFRSLAARILGILLLTASCPAATILTDGYAVRVWQTEDGLPQNVVTSAVQTQDGYLWFGTPSGLTRFDGQRFRLFNTTNTPELQDRRIVRLFEDANATLWIGHETGAITCYRSGRFESFAPSPGVENEKVIGLGTDEHGRLWAMRENGAVDSLHDGRRIPSLIASERPGVMGWTRGDNGSIWVRENGRAAHLTDNQLELLALDRPGAPHYDEIIQEVIAAPDGGVWVLRNRQIRKWHDGRWTEERGEYPWPTDTLTCGLQLRDGTLAIGTVHSGLYFIFGDGRRPVHFNRGNGLPQDWVRFLYEDREGNLWAGTGSAGLVSIHPTAFSVLNSPDHWKGCTVLSVAPTGDDGLWIGTDGAGLYRHSAGVWTHYGPPEGLGNQYIWSVTETAEGEVWAGDYWWGGPYRLEAGRFVRPPNVDETWSPALALVAVPETNELLVGNRDGLLRLKSGEPSTWLIKSPGGSADDVCAVVRDRNGAIWCGFVQGGLARLTDGQLSFFRKKDGLASDSVHCLLLEDEHTLWIGTADNGLSRWKDGKFSNV